MNQKIAIPRHHTDITLGQRIKYLRAIQKPFMTSQQLADISGIDQTRISKIENDRMANISLWKLNRIAVALGCTIRISLVQKQRTRPSPVEGECKPVLPEVTLPPIRRGKFSVQARRQALAVLRSVGKTRRPGKPGRPPKEISGKSGSKKARRQPFPDKPPTPPEQT